jgi:signal transduction histidine kinase
VTALDRPNLVRQSLPSATAQETTVASGLKHNPSAGDYNGHFARLILLATTLGAGYLLNYLAGGRPYFAFVLISGLILVSIGLVLGPRTQVRAVRIAVPLFDLAWITFAMYLTNGLSSFVLPMLYVVVAMAAMRGDRWEIGTTLAGAVTAIFVLSGTQQTGPALTLAVTQVTLLAAGALAIRLTATEALPRGACEDNGQLYETLLQKTSNAVFALAPETWQVLQANPAARALGGIGDEATVATQPLEQLVHFTDKAFPEVCRRTLAEGKAVVDAVTYASGRNGQKLMLRCNMTRVRPRDAAEFVQAIAEVVEEQQVQAAVAPLRDDFSVNYIPSLTHELNNHLAAIRLSAELAATTGRVPDFDVIQQQVDHCQDVLQTVVLQILRSAGPTVMPKTTPQADLELALERVLLLTRPHVLTGGVQLQVDIPHSLPPVVGFIHELQEALIRVIIQSVKSMSGRDTARALALTVTPRPEGVEVIIADAGPGLNARELAVIAGRSVAVSRAEDRSWEIVRDAVCRFGGDIQAANGLNGGMRLRLTFPLYVEQKGVA